jgi:hypothetical protein
MSTGKSYIISLIYSGMRIAATEGMSMNATVQKESNICPLLFSHVENIVKSLVDRIKDQGVSLYRKESILT